MRTKMSTCKRKKQYRTKRWATKIASVIGHRELWPYRCNRCQKWHLSSKQAAIADTHPKDGDVKQAPLVSGGGAGTAIAQPQEPSHE